MRRGRGGKIWRSEDGGKVIAISLGADYCAEHEWGIKGIKRMLGMSDLQVPDLGRSQAYRVLEFLKLKGTGPVGLDRMKQTLQHLVLHNLDTKGLKETSSWGKNRKGHTLWGLAVVDPWLQNRFDFRENLRENYYNPEREELIGYWGEGAFAVLLEDREVIEDLVAAFDRKDIAVWVGASGPFQNGGLIVAIASRLPADFVQDLLDRDMEEIELQRAVAQSGIHGRLEAAGLMWWALSPRWADSDRSQFRFWLNPCDQQNNNSGWYTVSDLDAWIQGEGPIPKTKS